MSSYTSHLAKVQEKSRVIATEDILSDQGMLIVKSGAEVNDDTCQKILKFKLLKPIENSIVIANQLTAKSIFEQINHLLNKDAYLKALDSKIGHTKTLQLCCLRVEKFPLLQQKLTVLDMEITHIFHQSLLSAYLAYLCGLINQLPQAKIEENFLAGLIHDIGYLHIDRYILTKPGQLTSEEWKKIQSHPVIAYEILKQIPGFPEIVARAVLEHHENLDGSGYPKAKTVHDLESLGQLINLLDNVIVIYQKQLRPFKRSLHDVIPIIQMNMHSYLPKVVSVIFKVLREVPLSPVNNAGCEMLEDLIEHVKTEQSYINKITDRVKATNEEISYAHNNRDLYALQNVAINILVILTSSGLDDPNNLDWKIESEDKEYRQNLYNEVEDIRLMQGEIIYQLQNYQKAATAYLNQNPDSPNMESINKTLEVFDNTARPAVPQLLKDYWASLKD
jgi:HD-GYP domain-containing protein (c-di-GMP phosphodiesterase class II)